MSWSIHLHNHFIVLEFSLSYSIDRFVFWVMVNMTTTLIFHHLVEDLAACWSSCWSYWQTSQLQTGSRVMSVVS